VPARSGELHGAEPQLQAGRAGGEVAIAGELPGAAGGCQCQDSATYLSPRKQWWL